MQVLLPVPSDRDDHASAGDFWAGGFGWRQALTAAALAAYVLAFFLPAGEDQAGWTLVATGGLYDPALPRPLRGAPGGAHCAFVLGFACACHGRWRAAGLWGAGGAALLAATFAGGAANWGPHPAACGWLAALLLLSCLLVRLPPPPPAVGLLIRDDPPRY